jgi:hypothetical protein
MPVKRSVAIIQICSSGLINVFKIKPECEFYDVDTEDEEYFQFFHHTCLQLLGSFRIEDYLSGVKRHQEEHTDPIMKAFRDAGFTIPQKPEKP